VQVLHGAALFAFGGVGNEAFGSWIMVWLIRTVRESQDRS